MSFEMVKTVKADDVIKEVPDMIKIDVEFATLQVLEGMDRILSVDKEMVLIVEDWAYDTSLRNLLQNLLVSFRVCCCDNHLHGMPRMWVDRQEKARELLHYCLYGMQGSRDCRDGRRDNFQRRG